MGNIRKYQCSNCKSIVESDFEESTFICGSCESICSMPNDFGPGVVIDDFLIIELLGEGGMGNVYLGYEFSLERYVALKILKDEFMRNEEQKNQFIYEARSVASLNHPNIIQAIKVGEENGIVYFVSEYVEGKNLKDLLIEEGPIDVTLLLDIAIEVVSALEYGWNLRKLVHRDIKPENIMVSSNGIAKLMDLGLSVREGYEVDEGEQIKGTPQYISPEQILGTEVDNRSDFYCLGATLYHLVSGRKPFEGSLQEIIKSHIDTPPVPLKKIVPGINETFAKIIHKLMAKDPDKRYQNAEALLSSLNKLKKTIEDEEVGKKHFKITSNFETKRNLPSSEHIQFKKKNTYKWAILAMLAIVAAVFIIFVVFNKGSNTSKNAADKEVEPDKTVKNLSKNPSNKVIETVETSAKPKKTDNPARTILIHPEADSFIRGGKYEKDNFGSASSLHLKDAAGGTDRKIYFRFSLNGLPKSFSSAKLRLYSPNSTIGGIMLVEDDSWEENSINYINAPKPVGQELAHWESGAKDYFDIDLTSIIKSEKTKDNKISLIIYGKTKTYVNFPSKDNKNKSRWPALVIEIPSL